MWSLLLGGCPHRGEAGLGGEPCPDPGEVVLGCRVELEEVDDDADGTIDARSDYTYVGEVRTEAFDDDADGDVDMRATVTTSDTCAR